MDKLERVPPPTWEELAHGPTSEDKQLLLQALALLSGQPAYEKMTLPEVYDVVVTALRGE